MDKERRYIELVLCVFSINFSTSKVSITLTILVYIHTARGLFHSCINFITSDGNFVIIVSFPWQVVDIKEVQHLKPLKLLRSLNLSNNPIQV